MQYDSDSNTKSIFLSTYSNQSSTPAYYTHRMEETIQVPTGKNLSGSDNLALRVH